MALKTDKENVMCAINAMGFTVFKNGQFHWNSKQTPDMLINEDGTIHCWTSNPFNNNKSNHGDLIDFIMANETHLSFKEAKEKGYKLVNLPIPDINTYQDNGFVISSDKKTGFIPENFIANFQVERKSNFKRYMELLKQALPSLDFDKQKQIASKYEIGYSKEADRLIMPIRDEYGMCVTLWKYNKNPNTYTNKQGIEVTPSKVTFTKGRERIPFNLSNLLKYREDKSKWIFLCAGEKDTLNAVGNGLRAVTLGAENLLIPEKYLHLFKGLKVVIVYDYDKAGINGIYGMKKDGVRVGGVLEQLKEVADETKVWDWDLMNMHSKINLFSGYDLTDYYTDKNKG